MTNNFAIMRIEKIKSVSRAGDRLRHNRRLIPCVTATPGVKNARVILNEQMRKDKYKSFRQIFRERLGNQKIRKNGIVAIEVLFTFSPDSIQPSQYKEWTNVNIAWVKKIFGEKNIIDIQCHYDEKTFHNHVFIIPQDEKERLNSRSFIGGHRNRMSELQSDYAKSVEKFGLKRGISRKITKAQHNSSKRWHAENAEKENRLKAYEEKFGTEKDWDFDRMLEFRKIIRKQENESENILTQEKEIEIEIEK